MVAHIFSKHNVKYFYQKCFPTKIDKFSAARHTTKMNNFRVQYEISPHSRIVLHRPSACGSCGKNQIWASSVVSVCGKYQVCVVEV